MEKSILKWSGLVVLILMLLTVSYLFFVPDYRAERLLAEELEYNENSSQYDTVSEDEKLAELADLNQVLLESEELGGKLRVQLPDGVDESTVEVTNDYLTQTIYVKFPTDCKDYFSEYHVQGSSSSIASIAYYNTSDTGVLMIGLSQFYEAEVEFVEDNLYLSFTDPHDLYEKVVVIDAGHGGSMPGATRDSICEKDIDLAIVLALKEILDNSEESIGVYYTRLDDSNPSLEQRVGLANALHADIFLSVHNNASYRGYSSLNGTQVLYSESDESERSQELARICLNAVCDACESRNAGMLKGDRIYIIRSSEVPVALIEVGFVSNRDELEKLNTPEYQKQAAEGIYQALLAAFESGF